MVLTNKTNNKIYETQIFVFFTWKMHDSLLLGNGTVILASPSLNSICTCDVVKRRMNLKRVEGLNFVKKSL
jgi:hypothetical protein